MKSEEIQKEGEQVSITIMGLGYVGFPTAMTYVQKGVKVYGFDINEKYLKSLEQGVVPFIEFKEEYDLKKIIQEGNFIPTNDIKYALDNSEFILVIVPTPVKEDHTPDLGCVKSAGELISPHLRKGHIVILESTVYPGVTEEVLKPILDKSGLKTPEDYGLAYVPERVNPGDAEHSVSKVARIVGAITPQLAEKVKQLYAKLIQTEPLIVRNIKTAEASKVIENIQRDLNIGLMNELALIFQRLDIDIIDVIKAASTKWNFNVFYPGPGVGGHCLPVDPYYLVKKAKQLGYTSQVITAGRSVNNYMPEHMSHLIQSALNDAQRSVKNSIITILGFSYKENICDIRESPAVEIAHLLMKKGAIIRVVEPFAKTLNNQALEHFTSVEPAVQGADAVVLVTAHKEFKSLDFAALKSSLRTPVFIDGRRIYDPYYIIEQGFVYKGVGWKSN